jgi:hypothetical protein
LFHPCATTVAAWRGGSAIPQGYSDRVRALSRLTAATAAAGIALLVACSGSNDEPTMIEVPTSAPAASSVLPTPRPTTTAPPAVLPHTPGVPPAFPETPAVPAVGDFCIGALIGKRAIDTEGNPIVCDNYMWRLDRGQTPQNPWGDQQREFAECLETHTPEQCRAKEHWPG